MDRAADPTENETVPCDHAPEVATRLTEDSGEIGAENVSTMLVEPAGRVEAASQAEGEILGLVRLLNSEANI